MNIYIHAQITLKATLISTSICDVKLWNYVTLCRNDVTRASIEKSHKMYLLEHQFTKVIGEQQRTVIGCCADIFIFQNKNIEK